MGAVVLSEVGLVESKDNPFALSRNQNACWKLALRDTLPNSKLEFSAKDVSQELNN